MTQTTHRKPGWIEDRINQLHKMLAANDYKGYDPFDLLNSPFLQWVPDRPSLQILFSKFGSRLAPDFLRKLLRVPPIEDPKIYACAYFAYRCCGKEEFQPFAREMIRRLVILAKHDYSGLYWGYDYKWGTLGNGVNPRGDSTLVPAAFAILALVYESVLTQGDTYHEVLRKALDYYHSRHRCQGQDGLYLGYFKNARVNTHNANLLGCAALTAGGHILADDRYFQTAAEAAHTSVAAVQTDGFLPYTDAPSGKWTDGFHHLYVIATLTLIARLNPRVERDIFEITITRLKEYYQRHFLNPNHTLNYYPESPYPVDCHNYAAAIIYSVLFDRAKLMDQIPATTLLQHIDRLTWMPEKQRYLHRIYKYKKDRRFFLRWNQAWMFWALCMVHASENYQSNSSNGEFFNPLFLAGETVANR